ncbi:MAG: nitroreductase [Lachnospiraceae bacterium]|nr:nitroreductase [Lachnospiraceae bacterium]
MTENEILKTIKGRTSVRKYNQEKIPAQKLRDILEAGQFAPTGGNSQSVHFTVITNPEIREKLRTLVRETFAEMEGDENLYKSIQNSIRLSKKGTYAFDYHAPALIVVSNRKGYPNAMADCACALQNMMLAAESLKIGSCWINQLHWLDENARIRSFLAPLGIGEDETICGSLALGCYDEGAKPLPKPRTGMKVDYVALA